MKYLLYAAILGFAFWLVSEVLEIVQAGYSPPVYYLTAAYHLFAGLGVWGLYKAQTPDKNVFNLAGAALTSLAYLSITLFPLQVMWSGLGFSDYLDATPVYKLLGLAWIIGMLLFSVSVIRTGFYPKWAGVIMVITTVVFAASRPLGLPMLLVNVNDIILSATVIYISFIGLKTVAPSTAGVNVDTLP